MAKQLTDAEIKQIKSVKQAQVKSNDVIKK